MSAPQGGSLAVAGNAGSNRFVTRGGSGLVFDLDTPAYLPKFLACPKPADTAMAESPAAVPPPVVPEQEPPLDDLMIAMDMVDMLRREEDVIQRELNSEEQEERLIKRMREIYTSQGIEVSDDVLARGIEDLRHDRFRYDATPPSLERTLAEIYIDRWKWFKRVFSVLAVVAAVGTGYWLLVAGPRSRALREIPRQLTQIEQSIDKEARVDAAKENAKLLADQGRQLMAEGKTKEARQKIADLQMLRKAVESEYELRIVAKGSTGVWRVPRANENARNYYIIVEPVAPDGTVLTLPIKSEEDNTVSNVSKWGLHVDEFTFQQVAGDKKDDGIIQNNKFGLKKPGYLEPEYLMPTTGGAITHW